MASFWMGHYNARTPKRHVLFANSPAIGLLDLGKLTKRARRTTAPKTCVSYVDGRGRRRYKGTKHLKGTESLGPGLGMLSMGLFHRGFYLWPQIPYIYIYV